MVLSNFITHTHTNDFLVNSPFFSNLLGVRYELCTSSLIKMCNILLFVKTTHGKFDIALTDADTFSLFMRIKLVFHAHYITF